MKRTWTVWNFEILEGLSRKNENLQGPIDNFLFL